MANNVSFANRVKVYTNTVGTGNVSIGSAFTGFQTFANSGLANNSLVSYVIEDAANNQIWEIGRGTYNNDTETFERNVIIESSNSNNAISLSGNSALAVTILAQDIWDGNQYKSENFTGYGNTGPYILNGTPLNNDNCWVYLDGLYQDKTRWTLSSNQIVLSNSIPNTVNITVNYVIGNLKSQISSRVTNTHVGTNSVGPFQLLTTPVNSESIDIYVDGVYQPKDGSAYTISGANITFSESISNTSTWDEIHYPYVAIGVPSANTVGASELKDSDQVNIRTKLGLTIGTDVQAYDATLAALAGVSTAADKLIYATGSDTFTTTNLTSFGRSLIDDADANAMRTTLELAPNVVSLTPSTNQNNYATGISTSAGATSYINIAPTKSIKITGIDTTNWETGKRIVIRNTTSPTSSTGRLIILERNSSSSNAANRFNYAKSRLSIMLMPGDIAVFYFDGTDLVYEHGNRSLASYGYFDWWYDYGIEDDGSTTGTGTSSGSGYSWSDVSGEQIAVSRLGTGTTATGRAHFLNGSSRSLQAGSGALLYLTNARLDQLSTALEEFTMRAGFSDVTSGTILDQICWLYDRTVSTNWQIVTMSNGTPTATTITGLTVSTNFIRLGVFVNGDGSSADFFYSTDAGLTWTFAGTITTTIPTGSSRTFNACVGMQKSVGTTAMYAYVQDMGYRRQSTV